MRLIFMGFQTWGHVALAGLLCSEHVVELVITHPESDHEYERIWADSVRDLALSRDIPVIERVHASDEELYAIVRSLEPDLIVCSDWRTWLKPDFVALARHRGLNVHDGLLPQYGGFSPINWAILRGEREVGLTAHLITEELDGGDIVLQHREPVGPCDTATDVVQRIFATIAPLTLRAIDLVADPSFRAVPQDRSRATFFHKRTARESRIDWKRPAMEILNLVRAQSDPYPNAFAFHNGRRLFIKRALPADRQFRGTPGRVFCRVDGGMVVMCGPPGDPSCGQGLIVETVQWEGAEPVPARDVLRPADYLE